MPTSAPLRGTLVAPCATLVTELQIPVGIVLVPIFVAVVGTGYLVILKNSSAVGGPIIRFGQAPAFAPASGMPLLPSPLAGIAGEGVIIDFFGSSLNAIANAALGGLLDVSIWST